MAVPSGWMNTWVWDGTVWEEIPSAITPNRSDARSVYDSRYNRIVLFGGGAQHIPQNDTWVFDGQEWNLSPPGIASRPVCPCSVL